MSGSYTAAEDCLLTLIISWNLSMSEVSITVNGVKHNATGTSGLGYAVHAVSVILHKGETASYTASFSGNSPVAALFKTTFE